MRCSSAESAAGVCREQAAQNMDLISKPRGKSTVWMYFGLKADETGKPMNTDRAVCRLCRKVVVSKGNTTNLRSHLRRRHPAEFIEITNLATSRAFAEAQGNICTKSSSIVCQNVGLLCMDRYFCGQAR